MQEVDGGTVSVHGGGDARAPLKKLGGAQRLCAMEEVLLSDELATDYDARFAKSQVLRILR